MRSVTRGKKPQEKAAKPAASRRGRKKGSSPENASLGVSLGRSIRLGATAIAITAALASIGYAWQTSLFSRTLEWGQAQFYQATAQTGLAVETVYAVGRTETDRADIIDALGIDIGDPILDFDPEVARQNLEALGWIKSATVRRNLPGTVIVQLEERQAIAIWQHEQRFVLIDREGVEIGEKDVHRHSHLKVVVGPDAPEHTAALLALLRSEPELEDRVIAAVRVGARRWNLRLEGGIDVSLPEKDAELAWRKLADYQREHEILSRTVGQIDLRHPDRMTVQLTEPGLQEVMGRNQGEET